MLRLSRMLVALFCAIHFFFPGENDAQADPMEIARELATTGLGGCDPLGNSLHYLNPFLSRAYAFLGDVWNNPVHRFLNHEQNQWLRKSLFSSDRVNIPEQFKRDLEGTPGYAKLERLLKADPVTRWFAWLQTFYQMPHAPLFPKSGTGVYMRAMSQAWQLSAGIAELMLWLVLPFKVNLTSRAVKRIYEKVRDKPELPLNKHLSKEEIEVIRNSAEYGMRHLERYRTYKAQESIEMRRFLKLGARALHIWMFFLPTIGSLTTTLAMATAPVHIGRAEFNQKHAPQSEVFILHDHANGDVSIMVHQMVYSLQGNKVTMLPREVYFDSIQTTYLKIAQISESESYHAVSATPLNGSPEAVAKLKRRLQSLEFTTTGADVTSSDFIFSTLEETGFLEMPAETRELRSISGVTYTVLRAQYAMGNQTVGPTYLVNLSHEASPWAAVTSYAAANAEAKFELLFQNAEDLFTAPKSKTKLPEDSVLNSETARQEYQEKMEEARKTNFPDLGPGALSIATGVNRLQRLAPKLKQRGQFDGAVAEILKDIERFERESNQRYEDLLKVEGNKSSVIKAKAIHDSDLEWALLMRDHIKRITQS